MKEYIWYVCYGSNMLHERFMHYINGGSYEGGGACHDACIDTAEPLAEKPYIIPHNMYFGNNSKSWGDKGVSFLDITAPGEAMGVAHLISRTQFEHIAFQKNGRVPQRLAAEWYNTVKVLGSMDGYDVVTLTNDGVRPPCSPSEAYLDTLRKGLKEAYTQLSDEDIDAYLNRCIENR